MMLLLRRNAVSRHQEKDCDAPVSWKQLDGFSLGPARQQTYHLLIDGSPIDYDVSWGENGPEFDGRIIDRSAMPLPTFTREDACRIFSRQHQTTVEIAFPIYSAADLDERAASGAIRAPINGRIAKIFVVAGSNVAKGDKIAIVEAMKMEHVITASVAGMVDKLATSEGAQVTQGALLVHIAEAAR
jgi:3-methylcrotonyl-CoA carboxylase alpha subunit